MGGGKGTTTTRSDIPEELRPLYSDSAHRIREAQTQNPLSAYTGPQSQAFQTAPRASQFGQAQMASGAGTHAANQQLASRQGLNRTPSQTLAGINTAGQAIGGAGVVPGQFGTAQQVAGRNVGIQGREQAAEAHALATQQHVGQLPGQFQGVQQRIDPRLADLTQHADRRITGEELMDSRSYQAAQQAFEAAILPQVQNSAAMAGLGRSTGLQQSMASAQAQYLLPVIQEELAREERAIDRGMGARQFGIQTQSELGLQEAMAAERAFGRFGEQSRYLTGLQSELGGREAARQENQIGRQMEALYQSGAAAERGTGRTQDAMRFLSGQQQAAGQQDLQRQLEGLYADERSRGLQYQAQQDAYNQLFQLGQSEQDYAQGSRDRQTQDFLRRQALSETALYQPFGQVAPSAIAQQSSSSKK